MFTGLDVIKEAVCSIQKASLSNSNEGGGNKNVKNLFPFIR
jgi:hypothetical protein